jgi:hypothetical protein
MLAQMNYDLEKAVGNKILAKKLKGISEAE